MRHGPVYYMEGHHTHATRHTTAHYVGYTDSFKRELRDTRDGTTYSRAVDLYFKESREGATMPSKHSEVRGHEDKSSP
ncbi:MAG: hypothetical protein QOI54_3323 [Actinomycetota bacterium]|jgi:hypothetical protein|nr:hypothetical protein [Actinomycetota bacterium]